MGGFVINVIILVTIRSPMNIDVQEGKVAVCSDLLREIDTPVDIIHMVTEALQLLRSLGQMIKVSSTYWKQEMCLWVAWSRAFS